MGLKILKQFIKIKETKGCLYFLVVVHKNTKVKNSKIRHIKQVDQ